MPVVLETFAKWHFRTVRRLLDLLTPLMRLVLAQDGQCSRLPAAELQRLVLAAGLIYVESA